MLTRFSTVDAITATMGKMVTQLYALAERREVLASNAVERAAQAKREADQDFAEAQRARGVAEKLRELVA